MKTIYKSTISHLLSQKKYYSNNKEKCLLKVKEISNNKKDIYKVRVKKNKIKFQIYIKYTKCLKCNKLGKGNTRAIYEYYKPTNHLVFHNISIDHRIYNKFTKKQVFDGRCNYNIKMSRKFINNLTNMEKEEINHKLYKKIDILGLKVNNW